MRTTVERLRARKTEEEGFTLIELLIVVIVLAILATIVIFGVGTSTKNAAVAACKSTVKIVETALEAYRAKGVGTYPASLTVLVTTTTKGPWLKQVPTATLTTQGYQIVTYSPTTGHFVVRTKATTTPGRSDLTATVCAGA